MSYTFFSIVSLLSANQKLFLKLEKKKKRNRMRQRVRKNRNRKEEEKEAEGRGKVKENENHRKSVRERLRCIYQLSVFLLPSSVIRPHFPPKFLPIKESRARV